MNNATQVGKWGEEEAARYLAQNGYTLIEKNYKNRFGEIDLIAEKDGVVAFIEVKLRNKDSFVTGAEAVTQQKIHKIVVTAGDWIIRNIAGRQPRFDVIEVTPTDGYRPGTAKINHIVNAFHDSCGHH